MNKRCAIWRIPCEEQGRGGQRQVTQYDSARAGGTYLITDSAAAMLDTRSHIRTKLTSWIVDQHRFGEEWPLINSNVITDIEKRRPLRVSERSERFFQYLNNVGYGLGKKLEFYSNKPEHAMALLCAWTECEDQAEAYSLLNLLRDEELIHFLDGEQSRLTPRGFARLEQVGLGGAPTNQAFVAMWFADQLVEAFDQGFEPAIAAAGYKAMRIDRKPHNGKIDDEIIAEIKRSRFVVTDFTSGLTTIGDEIEAIARGGVYYEAGFTQGIGSPLIWTVRSDCIKYVHFDTRQYAHIVWNDPLDLRAQLYNRIAAVIGEAPGARGLPK